MSKRSTHRYLLVLSEDFEETYPRVTEYYTQLENDQLSGNLYIVTDMPIPEVTIDKELGAFRLKTDDGHDMHWADIVHTVIHAIEHKMDELLDHALKPIIAETGSNVIKRAEIAIEDAVTDVIHSSRYQNEYPIQLKRIKVPVDMSMAVGGDSFSTITFIILLHCGKADSNIAWNDEEILLRKLDSKNVRKLIKKERKNGLTVQDMFVDDLLTEDRIKLLANSNYYDSFCKLRDMLHNTNTTTIPIVTSFFDYRDTTMTKIVQRAHMIGDLTEYMTEGRGSSTLTDKYCDMATLTRLLSENCMKEYLALPIGKDYRFKYSYVVPKVLLLINSAPAASDESYVIPVDEAYNAVKDVAETIANRSQNYISDEEFHGEFEFESDNQDNDNEKEGIENE